MVTLHIGGDADNVTLDIESNAEMVALYTGDDADNITIHVGDDAERKGYLTYRR